MTQELFPSSQCRIIVQKPRAICLRVPFFFPILQQRIHLGHVTIRSAEGVTMESKAGERRIEAVNRGMLEEFAPQMEVGGEFAAIRDA